MLGFSFHDRKISFWTIFKMSVDNSMRTVSQQESFHKESVVFYSIWYKTQAADGQGKSSLVLICYYVRFEVEIVNFTSSNSR